MKNMKKKISLFTCVMLIISLCDIASFKAVKEYVYAATLNTKVVKVTAVKLNKINDTLVVGYSNSLIATIAPNNATNKSLKWTSSNGKVVSVNNGVIKGTGIGTAKITVSTVDGNKVASCIVTVKPAVKVTSIKLNKPSDSIFVGYSDTLIATLAPSNATNKAVRWTTSNSKVVTVSNGVIKGIGAGTAKITATTFDGNKSVSCTVTVKPFVKVASIKLNKLSDSISVGNSETLLATILPGNATNKAVKWTTSNSKILTVTNGVIKGISAGTAKVTVTTVDGSKLASCNVTVVNNPIVTVKDVNLEKVIRNLIKKPTGTLYKSDVVNITNLDASGKNISDLSGIENLINLKELKLGDSHDSKGSYFNNITDISPLRSLINLQSLDLSINVQLKDISALSGLTNLKKLTLVENSISDISPLKNLKSLQDLILEGQRVSDISALKGLTNLQTLGLHVLGKNDGTDVSDISALSGLVNLQSLTLFGDNITDLNSLGKLAELNSFTLYCDKVSNIDGLKGLTQLQKLDLTGDHISDISALSGLINLKELDLGDMMVERHPKNDITDISPLKGLKNLQILNLAWNKISDVSALEGLTNLQSLYLFQNAISDSDKKALSDALGLKCKIYY